MATPSIIEIKEQILAKKAEFSSLDGLNSTSKLSIYNMWAYAVAYIIWLLYQFFELYQLETDQKIKAQKIYSLLWFRDKALSYRHGHPLVREDYDLVYSDEGYTEEEIEESMVVKRAAVKEIELNNRKFLFVKCATEIDGELAKLPDTQIQGIVDYFKRIKPAGTKLEVFSDKPDDLMLEIDFYYDPLVLTGTGARIDGTKSQPVQDAIRAYLKNLSFDGEFSTAYLEDLIQGVSGCSNGEAYIRAASYNYQTPANFEVINSTVTANSGYMQILPENLTINFIAKTVNN